MMIRVLSCLLFSMVTLALVGCGGKSQIDAPKVTGSVPQKMNDKDNARAVS